MFLPVAPAVAAETSGTSTQGQTAGSDRVVERQAAGERQAVEEHAELGEAAEKNLQAVSTDRDPDRAGQPGTEEWRPGAGNFDWIQLTSGEWLKGELKSMYHNKLEFDSDKLDLLTIDWDDVRYLKSYRKMQVFFDGQAPVTGFLQISEGRVYISHDYDDEEHALADLLSLSPAGETESDLWSIKFTLGLNLRSGNTNQVDYTSKLIAKRRTAKSRFSMDYLGNISKTNAGEGELVETINNHRVNAWLDIYVSRHFYYTPVKFEYYRDPFQNIDERITVGVGLGYIIYKTEKVEWNVTGGPSFLTTRYLSVQNKEDLRVNTSALLLGTAADVEISSTLDFLFKYNIQAAKADAGGYTHHMIATLESEITGRLDLDISLLWDRIGQPTENNAGETPTQDDYRMIVGITYTY